MIGPEKARGTWRMEMAEWDLFREMDRLSQERIPAHGQRRASRKPRPSPREQMKDPEVAERVEAVRRALDNLPEVRQERVEKVKKQLQQGTFEPDGKSIAEKLLLEALLNEML